MAGRRRFHQDDAVALRHLPPAHRTDVSGVKLIDDWIERLGAAGVHVVYSSGTSGAFSFVPRDKKDWGLARTANVACLAPLLARRIGGGLSSHCLSLSPSDAAGAFARLAGKRGCRTSMPLF